MTPNFAARAAIGATMIALAATGCGSGGSGNNSSSSPESITVGVPPNATGSIVDFAKSKGYFEEQGLEVTTTDLNGGAAIVPALQSDAIQIGQSNVLSVIQGAAEGLNTPCFTGALDIDDEGTPLPLIAGGSSGIASPDQLEGKTVAVNALGGFMELAANAYLDGEGVDYTRVKYIATPLPNMPAAVNGGQVAAAVTAEPFTTQIVNQGGTVVTGNVYDSVSGSPTFACFNATADWLDQNSGTATKFIAAMTEASRVATDDTDAFKEFLKSEGVPAAIANAFDGFTFTTDMSESDVTAWEDAARQYGILTGERTDPSLSFRPVGQD